MIQESPQLKEDAPWKRRFSVSRIQAQFARGNPDHVLVKSNESGIYELYAYDIPSNTLSQLTRRPSGTAYGTISPDGRGIFYVDDKKGNETGHVVRVPFEGGLTPLDITPTLPDYTLVDPFIDGSSSHLGLTVPGPEGFDSFIVDIDDSIAKRSNDKEPRLINRSKKMAFGPLFSQDSKLSLIVSAERYGGIDFTLIAFDTKSGQRISELYDEASRIDPAEFSPIEGDQRILAMSNASGLMRPLIWDPTRGKRIDLDVRSLEGEVTAIDWSPDAKKVLLLQTLRAKTHLWLYDLGTSALAKVMHPEGLVDTARFQTNEVILLTWQDSENPSQIMAINTSNPSSAPKVLLAPKNVPKSRPWSSISFKSSDGQEIQGWLALPEGVGPFPTILDTHGGPTAAQFNVFSPRSQVWLDHGFAFITINYRGSTTFGKEFEKKINGDLGHWEVEDMLAARRWLLENNVAREDEIFLTGWSYGGYLTLQAMGTHPECWAGGMGGVVVADWVSEYDDEPEAMRGYDVALWGGTPKEKEDAYKRGSPINYVERLVAPLLIIQGRNDVRCPPRQVELYDAKARALGKNVKVVWYDTGHAGSGMNTKLAIKHHEIMLRWMYDILLAKRRPSSQA